MFRLLLIISLFHQGYAIQCSETTAIINSVCEGDLCYQVGSGASRGCISGMKYLNEGCYYAKVVEFFVCFCRTDFCNLYLLDASASKSVSNVEWGNRSFPITIYSSITCISNNFNSISTTDGQFCASNGVLNKTTSAYSVVLSDETSFADGLFGIHPPAYLTSAPTPFYFGGYYSFQTNPGEASVYQLCNWEICNENGYTPPLSTNLECFLGDIDGKTCQGQYCFIQITKSNNSTIFGCFTQDDSKAMGRVEVGIYQFDDKAYYFCAQNDCNIDLATAIASIAKYQPQLEPFNPYVPSPRSTPQPAITSTIGDVVSSSATSTEVTAGFTTDQSSTATGKLATTTKQTITVTGKSTTDISKTIATSTTEKSKTTKGEVTETQSTATNRQTTQTQTQTVPGKSTTTTLQPNTLSQSATDGNSTTVTRQAITDVSTTVTSEKASKTTTATTEANTEKTKTTKAAETTTEAIITTKVITQSSEKTTMERPTTKPAATTKKPEKTTKKEKTTTTTTTMATTTTTEPSLIDEMLRTPYIPVLIIITVLCVVVAVFNLVFYLITKRLPFCSN